MGAVTLAKTVSCSVFAVQTFRPNSLHLNLSSASAQSGCLTQELLLCTGSLPSTHPCGSAARTCSPGNARSMGLGG